MRPRPTFQTPSLPGKHLANPIFIHVCFVHWDGKERHLSAFPIAAATDDSTRQMACDEKWLRRPDEPLSSRSRLAHGIDLPAYHNDGAEPRAFILKSDDRELCSLYEIV